MALLGDDILGLGTDLVEIARLAKSIERTGKAFLEKVYAPAELEVAPEKDPRRMEFLAGRWAAKEALAKALGTGITEKCRLQEICVLNDPSGRPVMTLSGSARESADALGVRRILLSISHEHLYATATVLLTR